MGKGQFKLQASSSRVSRTDFVGFSSVASSSYLSYCAEPPNLSSIQNAYIIVAFKNLSKKDENSRLRALQDLQVHLNAQAKEKNGIEDAVIEAWVSLYPRLSIDSFRMVRDQSHTIQFELLSFSQKRMTRRVSRFIGSWLAGQFDRDSKVAFNVKRAVNTLLPTNEKLVAFYCRHQSAVLNYACNAIQETPETLSDERWMSKDDRWSKYIIVIYSTVSLVLELLQKLDEIEMSELQESYNQFLSTKELWYLVSCENSGIRRIICELLIQSCQKQRGIISKNLDVLSKAFISKGLVVPQQGTTSQFLDALQILTKEFPEVWKLHCSARSSRKASTKNPLSELNTFILAGPRLESINFWNSLQHMMRTLPSEILPKNSQESVEFLQNLEASFSGRAGMKIVTRIAWNCYLDISGLIIAHLPSNESKSDLLRSTIYPLFDKYFVNLLDSSHSLENNSKTKTSGIDLEVALQAYKFCLQRCNQRIDFQDKWEQLGAKLIKKLKLPLPEQTKNFRMLQDLVLRLSKLWFSLLEVVLKYYKAEIDFECNNDPLFMKSIDLIKTAFEVLIAQDGKSYSAAGILEDAVIHTPVLFTSDPDRLKIIQDLLMIYLPKFLHSSSAVILIRIIFRLRTLSGLDECFEPAWLQVLKTFLSLQDSIPAELWIEIVTTLLSSNEIASIAQDHQPLQNFLLDEIDSFILGKRSTKQIINASFESGALSQLSAEIVRDSLMKYLVDDSNFRRIFFVLDLLNNKMHHLVDIQSQVHIDLLLKLILVEKRALIEVGSNSELAKQSKELKNAIMGSNYIYSVSKLVSTDLKKIGNRDQDLFIGHLIGEAKEAIKKINDPRQVELILPTTEDWFNCLHELLDYSIEDALAVVPDFGSVIYLISDNFKKPHPVLPASFDTHGLTMPLRKAIFTSEIFFERSSEIVSVETQYKLLKMILLTFEVVETELNIYSFSRLFNSSFHHDNMDVLDRFLSNIPTQLQTLASNIRIWPLKSEQDPAGVSSDLHMKREIDEDSSINIVMGNLIADFIKLCELRHPISFFAGKSLIRILRVLVNVLNRKEDLLENWILSLSVIKLSSKNIAGASAILVGLGEHAVLSTTIRNLCNHLISNLLSLSIDSNEAIDNLILLNSCLSIYDGKGLPVAQNRLVFSVKHVISWTESVHDNGKISEICRLLERLLPPIKDIYGSFWETCLRLCVSIWEKQQDKPLDDKNLSAVLTSLRLYSSLKEIEDANDDLSEALIEIEEHTSGALLALLFMERPINYKPLYILDEILAKLVFKIPPDKVHSINKYYILLSSEYFWIQSAAYVLISKVLPSHQQQLCVDVLLENKDASLPTELLSYINTEPSHFERKNISYSCQNNSPQYLTIRNYSLAWLLVFKIFAVSSYKVRNDLNNFLKSHKSIEPLMDFIFQILHSSDEKPIDLKKENLSSQKIRDYDLLISISTDNRENDLIWILVTLYFQSLKYAPSVVKNWWLNTKKQAKNTICVWTKKYISPLLIEEELNTVASWAENQDSLDDDQNLRIKVARNVREISVGYEIDDMTLQFLICIPENYPLDLVRVESVNRVGVSEQKWNSFLMTTNGVINFLNGSITDSLVVFRKNIISALEGQTECAICYSIISADRKLSDKKCGTCSNIFHSKCLFQWFKSSNQSNCPLCRNPFNY